MTTNTPSTQGKFDIFDFGVLIASLVTSAAIGLYYKFSGGKQNTTQEFLLGDKSQSILPVAVSLTASIMSSIALLGVSAEVYLHSAQFIVINLGYLLVAPLIAFLYLPVYFKLQATSVFEYLEKRFSSRVRFIVSCVYFFQTLLYMGVVLYAPALTFEALTGVSHITSILITGAVCTFYSTLGGMKAVIATDLFQLCLMFVALFIIIFTAITEKNGISPIWNIAKDHGRLQIFNFDPDPTVRHSFWSLVIGGGWTYLSLCTVNQTQVQRYMTLRDLSSAKLMVFMSLPVVICLSLTTSFAGLAIFSKYYNCDPIMTKRITRGDQLMPLYVLDAVGNIPGLTGFFISGIFSAALSTLSSILNSLAAITLEDYIKPVYTLLYKISFPANRTIHVTKLLVLLFGGLCIVLALMAKIFGGLLQASLTILGVTGGPILGIFSLGMFVPIANEVGSLSGLIISLIFTMVIAFGRPKPTPIPLPVSTDGCVNGNTSNPYSLDVHSSSLLSNNTVHITREENYPYLYRISYLWYVMIGFVLTLVLGSFISFLVTKYSSEKVKEPDYDLFTPILAKYLKRRKCDKQRKNQGDFRSEEAKEKTNSKEAISLL